jgi:hypothetical protein
LDDDPHSRLVAEFMDLAETSAGGEGEEGSAGKREQDRRAAERRWRDRVMTYVITPWIDELEDGRVIARRKRRIGKVSSRLGPGITVLSTGLTATVVVSAVTKAVTTALGGTSWSTWAPVALFLLGLLLSVLGAVLARNNEDRNRAKVRRYERLVRDLRNYAILVLPTATKPEVYEALSGFSALWEQAGATSSPPAPISGPPTAGSES